MAENFVVIYDKLENMTTEEIRIYLGATIRRLRESKNLSQQDLAAMCNYEKSTMSRIEKGGSNFTAGTLNKIVQALGIPFRDLYKDLPG
ncbi:MAG: helix-turn-helix domain-containing protein [Alistipes sp.]|nr:helix-turn-helix domain-containing protein [Alistipes sp.]